MAGIDEASEQFLRDEIRWLGFRLVKLKERAEFLERHGEDASDLRSLMFELRMEITGLKKKMSQLQEHERQE